MKVSCAASSASSALRSCARADLDDEAAVAAVQLFEGGLVAGGRERGQCVVRGFHPGRVRVVWHGVSSLVARLSRGVSGSRVE